MRSIRGLAGLAVCLCVLVACGGGGGGSSSSGGGGGASRGTFSLSGTSADFTAIQGSPGPQAQTFTLTVTGSGVAAVGAAYLVGQTPAPWLSINLTGTGNNYVLSVVPIMGMVGPGSYTATFAVGTADASGGVLQSRNVTVTFRLDAPIDVNVSSILRNYQFGDAIRTENIPLSVVAPNRQWTITSDAPWLQVPAGTQTGNATVTGVIDQTGLAPGTHSGSIRIANSALAIDARVIPVSIIIAPAAFSVAQDSVLFGGDDGRTTVAATAVNFTLTSGTGVHPFAAAVTTDSGGSWLTLDRTAGMVGAAGGAVSLNVNRGQLVGGTYTAQLTITATVYGTVFTQAVPVTFNLEAHRLVVNATGVGLSRVAGRDVLTRKIKVFSTLGSTSTPWSAVSDAPWLTVTPAGMTGGEITLTAAPGTLGLETTHFATVTVTSSDTHVENTQTIRVGLYLSNVAPVSIAVPGPVSHLATSPVEPVVAITGGSVSLYNVYSGALIRTFSAGAQPGAITYSPDGLSLFVYDITNRAVNEYNPATGLLIRSYDSVPIAQLGMLGSAITVMRPNGYPMLITPSARTYDLTTHDQYSPNYAPGNTPIMAFNARSLTSSPDQTLLVSDYGGVSRLIRTALQGGGLVHAYGVVSVGTAQGREGEACVSAAGDRIYTASGYPYNFPATSIATGQVIQVLPGDAYPDSVQCVWNGLVIGGIQGYYSDQDIYVYNGVTGVLRGTRSSNGTATGAYRDSLERGLAVSADGTRLMSAWSSSYNGAGVYFHSLPTPE